MARVKYTAVKRGTDNAPQITLVKGGDLSDARSFSLSIDKKQLSDRKVEDTFFVNENRKFILKNQSNKIAAKTFFEKDIGGVKKENLLNTNDRVRKKLVNYTKAEVPFKGKRPDEQQNNQEEIQRQLTTINDREVDYSRVDKVEARTRIGNEQIDEKDIAREFKKWDKTEAWSKEKAEEIDDDAVYPKSAPPSGYIGVRTGDQVEKKFNAYLQLRQAVKNSDANIRNKNYRGVIDEYKSAMLSAEDLPIGVRRTESVGYTQRGKYIFNDRKGYLGRLEENFETASRKTGLGKSDELYKEWSNGFWTRPSVAAQIEKLNVENEKELAKADLEQAKALTEEGKERAAKSKSIRIQELEAERKASASFLNRLTFGLVGRKSLAALKVEAERATAESATKQAKAEGKAAEESLRAQRRAIQVQSGAFGARERAQKLESRELDRLEERIAEGRPITKADQKRLTFLRNFSEETPSSFARGEAQVRSVIAPDAETIQQAKNFMDRKRGAKK